MSVERIWADKHRIMSSRNGGTPEVIAMCKNSGVAVMLACAWNVEMERKKQHQPKAESDVALVNEFGAGEKKLLPSLVLD